MKIEPDKLTELFSDIQKTFDNLRAWEIIDTENHYFKDEDVYMLCVKVVHKTTKIEKCFNVYYTETAVSIHSSPRPNYNYYLVEFWQPYVWSGSYSARFVDINRYEWCTDEDEAVYMIKKYLRVYWNK